MDEFAIDLDKVLDDFEKSEDSSLIIANKNKQTDVNSSLGLQSHTTSFPRFTTEANLYHFEATHVSGNNHYNGGLSSYLRNQQPLSGADKLDLSEADFSASTSSFSIRSVSAADGSTVDKTLKKTQVETKPAYPSLYTSFGLDTATEGVSLKREDYSKIPVKSSDLDYGLPSSTAISNGYGEEEEVLAVEIPINSDLTEQPQIEIKLITSSEVVEEPVNLNTKEIPEIIASLPIVEDTPPKINSTVENPEIPTLIFSPMVERSSSEINGDSEQNAPKPLEVETNVVTGLLPWEALEAELDILPKSSNKIKSEVVSFDDLESVNINPDELENYLKDLEDIDFATTDSMIEKLAKNGDDIDFATTDSMIEKLAKHGDDKPENTTCGRIEDDTLVKSLSIQEENRVVGGARPKVKDNTRYPKQQITENKVETLIINKDDAIKDECDDVMSDTRSKSDKIDKITISEENIKQMQSETEKATREEGDVSISSLTCSTDLSPSKEKPIEDSQILNDADLASLSDDIEGNSYEEASTEESLETSNSKLSRPTSLNLPSPLLASQPQVVPAILDDSVVAPIMTDISPSPELSETDSALPPSPEVGTENQLNSEIEENGATIVEEEGIKEASPGEEASESLEPSEMAAENNVNTSEYIPELSEEEQLLGKIKPFWMPDEEAPNCLHCDLKFTVIKRRHHCRGCGKVLCAQCCNSKARISYLEDKEARVCSPCLVILNKVAEVERLYLGSAPEDRDRVPVEVIPRSDSPSPNHSPSIQSTDEKDTAGWNPNPNNPQDYCSQVSPLQQAQAYSSRPPPVVMVPVGVLKRGDKPKREPKQVMFSDGIRPGGDLTELDTAISPKPKIHSRKTGSLFGRPQRRVLEKGSPDTSETDDKLDSTKLLECLQDENSRPIIFALTKNLYVSIKLVNLDCCLQKQCWVFASRGLNCVGQDEVMVVLERLPNENALPRDIFLLFTSLYDNASMGSPISELGHLLFPEGLLGSREHGAFLFIRPTYQCLSKLHFPQAPYLVAVLLQKWEVPWAKVFPLRLMLRIGAEFRYYPCPLVSVRLRKPVYGEIGHTIMSVLADFRNYQYTLPTIPGVVVCMEDKKTTVSLPRNRYTQICRVVASSNEHVLSFGAAFSIESDSHLVCVQDDDGNYQTQAINIQNTTRKVTGASFIVFSGALKTTSGLTAKSSIVEDGLLVQITPESMIALKNSIQQMKDFVIDCGQVSSVEPDEQVFLKWTDDDKNFNIGVRSVIDGRNLEGIQSVRVHSGTDYSSDRFLIRWTEVFFLTNENLNQRGEPTDPSKLADGVAQAFCLALVSHLPLLIEADLTKIGLRVTLDSEQVGYEVGSKEEPLPCLYMIDLDTSLIPVITNASSGNLDSGSLTLELVFHILRK